MENPNASEKLPITGDALLAFKKQHQPPLNIQRGFGNTTSILDDPLSRLAELDGFSETGDRNHDEHETAAVVSATLATLVFNNCSRLGSHETELRPFLSAMERILERHPESADYSEPDLPVTIMPGLLLLGDKFAAWDLELLAAHRITHILNAADGTAKGPIDHSSAGLSYAQLDAEDDIATDVIASHFAEASEFIERARKDDGVVLLHCHAGINRSGALAMAYLMLSERLPLLEATRLLASARGTVVQNGSFRIQLLRLAQRVSPVPVLVH